MSDQNHPSSGHGGKGRDPLLLNKIAGGILSAGLLVWIAIHLAGALTGEKDVKKPVIKTAEAPAAATSSGIPSIDGLIVKADVKKGQAFVQQQCAACHTLNKGGAAGAGPNLYGVMGDPMFKKAGYTFSGAVKKVANGVWTYQKMNEWLDDPQKFAPGTRMGYTGIKNDHVRADAIAYLRTLADSPIPLPKPGAGGTAVASKGAAPAGLESGAPVIATLYASADASKGQAFFEQQCSACHSVNKGGANGVGPNLYGVVGAPMFAKAGYTFSGAAKQHADGKWTPHELDEWLYAPMKAVPATHMAYPGIKNNQTRADVIAYLNKQSDHPVNLAAASGPAAKAASAAGAAPTGLDSSAPPVKTLMAKAAPAKGQAMFQQQCSACHSINKGGANGVGPNLYGVLGSKMFATAGYSFSSAAKTHATGGWTVHEMNEWLYDPMKAVPGTHMAYPGIKNNVARANMIAYLNQQSDHPETFK